MEELHMDITNGMGPSYNYFRNRKDRQHFIDDQINNGEGMLSVVYSTMRSTTYYAAVQNADGDIFAAICPTYLDHGELVFDLKDETEGPLESDCPMIILSKLTPTVSKIAREWRDRCYAVIANKKRLTMARKEERPVRVTMHDGRQIDVDYDRDYQKWIEIENPRLYLSRKTILANKFEVLNYTL